MRTLSVPEKHELRVARDTLRMNPAMARVMGGPSARDAWHTVYRLTGRWPTQNQVHPALWDRAMKGEQL